MKTWQRINIKRAFKYKLDRNSLERMYFSSYEQFSNMVEYGITVQKKIILTLNQSKLKL